MTRTLRTALLAGLLALVAAGHAAASSVFLFHAPGRPAGSPALASFNAAPGEENKVVVGSFRFQGRVWVAFAQVPELPLTADPRYGCQLEDPRGERPGRRLPTWKRAFCPLTQVAARARYWAVVDLGNRDDSVGALDMLPNGRGLLAYGGAGSDFLVGGDADDYLCTAPRTGAECSGVDPQSSRLLQNNADGGRGDDVLVGGPAPDGLAGGPGDDRLSGGFGEDVLLGGAGDDTLFGDEGDDWLDTNITAVVPSDASDGNDRIDGGPGVDNVGYAFSRVAAVIGLSGTGTGTGSAGGNDTWTSAERTWGSSLGDTIRGGQGEDWIAALGGGDLIEVQGDPRPVSPDTVDCGEGDDFVTFDRSQTTPSEVAGDGHVGCEVETPDPPDQPAS